MSEDSQVQLVPDKTVAPSKFIPIPNKLAFFRAHPDTIRALKKEIWVMNLNEEPHYSPCPQCNQTLERQFWYFCPYCGMNYT
jgi:hypothetical protein